MSRLFTRRRGTLPGLASTLLACWLLLLLSPVAQAGRVLALDGTTWEGDLVITNGAVLVLRTNAVLGTIALTNLQSVSLEHAEVAAAGDGPGLGWLGYYFSNTNTEGNAFVRLDEIIDFDWGEGSPAPDVPPDRFGVVWSGELEAPASGAFNFTITADDAARLYFTNALVLDVGARRAQPDGAGPPVSVTLPLEAGVRYPMRVVYTELSGPARVRLFWRGPNVPRSLVPKAVIHPAGLGSQHLAEATNRQGLLATYYRDPEFAGATFTRVDPMVDFDWSERDPAPGVGRTNFSVRWSGRIQADYTEEYTFYTLTDERVRLWLDGKLLLDRPQQAWLGESKESVALVAGEKYDFRMETRSTSGGAVARLFWSSASVAKTNPPATHLFPSLPPPKAPPSDSENKTGPGIVLRNGSFLAGPVQQASQTSVQLGGRFRQQPLTTIQVARILCQPLSPALAKRIVPGRPGVLLTKGDFVDGEFRSLENDRVSLSSILFGVRTFDARTEVLVVALRDVGPETGAFTLRLRDRSLLHPGPLELEPGGLKFIDSALGSLRVPAGEILEFRRRTPSNPPRRL